MKKILLAIVCLGACACGVKNDVIPPEKPWIIFEPSDIKSKKALEQKKLKNGKKKNVNK